MPTKQDAIEFIGGRYGRLVILEDLGCPKKVRRVKAVCDCGTIKDIALPHLKGGKIISCGCNTRENTIKRNLKHGLNEHPLNSIWQGMKGRCNYSKHIGYMHYGGRGIKVCEEWEQSLQAFHDWSLSHGYLPGLQIDRINNNGNYEPKNCRWVTKTTNLRNMSTNRIIVIDGESKCLSEWAEIYGISSAVVMDRLNKLHWDASKAFTTPVRKINYAN